jgi:hypothetical protein
VKLVILNGGPDTAGVGIGLKQAFDKYAVGWETRSVSRSVKYLDYPTDIVWPRKTPIIGRQVLDLVRQADVVHVMDAPSILQTVAKALRNQTIIVHHLGSHFRMHPLRVSALAQSFGAVEVTDSIDLLYPHVGWLPTAIDTEALATLRAETYQPSKRIRIAHAPTHREMKSTDIIIGAIHRLSKKYPIDFDLIEKVSNRECLERKARADIFVDQLLFGFGVNNIECWAMGIPVVSGLVDPEARARATEMWGLYPWADANADSLKAKIERLIIDPGWRAELGQRGRAHAEQWHSQRSVVEQSLATYERARQKVAA